MDQNTHTLTATAAFIPDGILYATTVDTFYFSSVSLIHLLLIFILLLLLILFSVELFQDDFDDALSFQFYSVSTVYFPYLQ